LKRAHEYLDEARKRAPNDAVLMCSEAVLLLIEGDLAHSRAEWKRAFALDPEAARLRARHPSVQWLLRQHGIEDAEALFRT
jgi:Flp pilus assembly protein TadD